MADAADGYDAYYTDRLWQLLPGVYRARDSDDAALAGPLQELVGRIGAQVAVVRRSIDRLWADQAIETSDDWVISYIGDLLDTNLVDGLDAAARRRDVAKTIHYRRRKGTLAVLEEIARDVTGWDAHVVEAFRRLSRTRHGLDPPVGPGPFAAALPTPCPHPGQPADAPDPSELLRHEGLIGTLTSTPASGFADLRSAHGASLAYSPFDEYFHTADVRLGQGAFGHFGIPKLLVFLWRLQSFEVVGGTPVHVRGCPRLYTFDPTGRTVPLFLPPLVPEADAADTWTSAVETQVPGPLTTSLMRAITDPGDGPPPHARYPDAAALSTPASARSDSGPLGITIWPETGQLTLARTHRGPITVSYQYGFPATIGAGPYDRTLLGDAPQATGTEVTVAGGTGLGTAVQTSNGGGTVTIADSRTYIDVESAGSTASPIGSLLVRAGPRCRPVVRLRPPQPGHRPTAWVFTGDGDAELVLDGLLVTGGDIVLRGAFKTVRLTGCTTDPGTRDDAGTGFALSVDGRPLAPVRIWIEADPAAAPDAPGAIGSLLADHCVLGPIRTRNGGGVETVTITDSIVQGMAPAVATALDRADIYDPQLLAQALGSANPLAQRLFAMLPKTAQKAVGDSKGGPPAAAALTRIISGLNTIIAGPASIDLHAFAGVPLPPDVVALAAEETLTDFAPLNRRLLEAAYPVALSPAAIAIAEGVVDFERVSVLGRAFVHRLNANDSIMADFTVAEDAQEGCVRFSAVSDGSSVPRPYCSVTIAAAAALLTSTRFGDPGYGQLLETADRTITSGAAGATITEGADSGSEMGAFSSQLAPIKERGLLIKYDEYMPLGATPVVVHVT